MTAPHPAPHAAPGAAEARPSRRGESGFTLFEALVAVAMTGLILALLGAITGQWLPRWRAGYERLQRAELVGLALDRLSADLAAAQFVTPIADTKVLFYGASDSVTFVRTPIGPKPSTGPAPTGLEIIRYASDEDGALNRSRVVFTPEASAAAASPDFEFSDASLLIRPPLAVSFGYAGPDRAWSDSWANGASLPAAVRISVRDASSGELLAASTAVLIHVDAPAACAAADAGAQCLTQPTMPEPKKPSDGASGGARQGGLPAPGATL